MSERRDRARRAENRREIKARRSGLIGVLAIIMSAVVVISALVFFVFPKEFNVNSKIPFESEKPGQAVSEQNSTDPIDTVTPTPDISVDNPPELTPDPDPTPSPKPAIDIEDPTLNRFFDGAVFVGDSITQGLQNYVTRGRQKEDDLLGDARFAAMQSYNISMGASLNPSKMHSYRGKNYNLPDVLAAMEAKKCFIMLGTNDAAGNVEVNMKKYATILDNISAKNPEIEIYVQSCTPVTKSGESKIKNSKVDAFNAALGELCAEKGVNYIDISSAMKGSDNTLKSENSSDNYVHMSAKGAAIWVSQLYKFALSQYDSDVWTPAPEEEIKEQG